MGQQQVPIIVIFSFLNGGQSTFVQKGQKVSILGSAKLRCVSMLAGRCQVQLLAQGVNAGHTAGWGFVIIFQGDQIRSVAQSCLTLCDPMNRSTPGLPVHHQLPEFTQTHVHQVNDAIQPSHPLSSPSPPAPNPSQHQSLFQ